MAKGKKDHTSLHAATKTYETRDANFKNLMFTGLGLMGLMVFGLAFAWVIIQFFTSYTPEPGAPAETIIVPREDTRPAEPRLQADPHKDLVAIRKIEDSVLTTYGWVNRDSALVRVPISRAKQLLLERGLPTRARAAEK